MNYYNLLMQESPAFLLITNLKNKKLILLDNSYCLLQVALKCWNVTGEQNGVEREITHHSNIVPPGVCTHSLYVAP